MAVIPMDILEKARKDCQRIIDQLKHMPMSNIINAIEQMKACQIILLPIQTKDITNTCLATCEVSILMGKNENKKVIDKKLRHHFIHYVKSDNKELEKLRVAHECGHCYNAWPLKEKGKLYKSIIPKVNHEIYILKFDLQEEQYADAFASIMVNYPFYSSEGFPDVVIDKKLLDKIEEYANKGYLNLTFFGK